MIYPLISVKKGDPCVIINATIRSNYEKDYFMIAFVQLYNTSGEKVGQVTKIGSPWKSFEQVYIKSNVSTTFEVYVKYDKKDVESYEISLDAKLLDKPLP